MDPHTLANRMPQGSISRKLPKDKKKGRSHRDRPQSLLPGPLARVLVHYFSITTVVLASVKVAPAGTM
jgi:hypothetical protein